ncbi:hypothetical protein HDV05_007838 [Chytridiales sp. JEL 0842]|nr:hypothetical protein HDV05_007838 [Chytridiales sp. JEL 0842]
MPQTKPPASPASSTSPSYIPPKPPSQFSELKLWASTQKSNTVRKEAFKYVSDLFPIFQWLPRYNTTWLMGDLIAGVTVGLVVIPQAIAYADKLVGLPAQFGLYSAFMGILLYAIFATSKDVTIGPTAVLSLLLGQTLAANQIGSNPVDRITFAITLSFVTGVIQTILGLLRLGIVIDFVPISVITGFTTGAGIQIIIGQTPSIAGISGIDTNAAPYQVLISFFKNIGRTSRNDVVFGLTALVLILTIKYGSLYLSKRWSFFKYVSLMRNGFVVILYSCIAYAVRDTWKVKVAGPIPSGFSGIVQPKLNDSAYFWMVVRACPAIVTVSLLEHVAVVKAYGRINGYKPNDNQEFCAVGIANLLGSFCGAYPATGSFSRSAIKSQSGVKSPMAAFFTGVIVLVALFWLTPAFFWIPGSVLSSVIVAAIAELIASPSTIRELWDTQFVDFLGFLIALVVTFFSSIENGIFSAVGFSILVLLVRIARPHIRILSRTSKGLWIDPEAEGYALPPSETLTPPPPGVLVFRVDESLSYPNATFMFNGLKQAVLERFRYTGVPLPVGERLWSDNSEELSRLASASCANGSQLPALKAIIFDFSAVNSIDFTGVQALLDAKEDLSRFAGRPVSFHFAHVRRHHLRVVWRVPTLSAASVDATPAFDQSSSPAPKKSLVSMLGGKSSNKQRRSVKDSENGRFFHASVDEALECLVESGDLDVESHSSATASSSSSPPQEPAQRNSKHGIFDDEEELVLSRVVVEGLASPISSSASTPTLNSVDAEVPKSA